MTLIKCPECGKEISDNANKCPNCGNPMYVKKETFSAWNSQCSNLRNINIISNTWIFYDTCRSCYVIGDN